MINLFKKGFIYLALMVLVLVSVNVESALATEVVDYEEGVTNLNNTPENSAVVGSRLLKPETGWKRYDQSNSSFIYEGKGWSEYISSTTYNGSMIQVQNTTEENKIKFVFYGTKIRIIDTKSASRKLKNINIDDVNYEFNTYNNGNAFQIMVFEKLDLPLGLHKIEIKNITGSYLSLDAIDMDGYLISENEMPSTESITLDKNSIELLEGNKDKLTATVSPDTAKMIWTSSDDSIATVDQDGNVTAIREGTAIITAKIENTDIIATSTVIVKKPISESSSAILSITLVNGITKEYDVTNTVLNNYLNWFESVQGTSTFKFIKTISPYKKVTEYIVHDKIASFEVREY